ncbi:MAG: hypothetical protein F6K04_15210 [Leptolyngbya sp. SIO4C5]|nr:hypothetical protein [Leptolyngbya sp. SIO4C5]
MMNHDYDFQFPPTIWVVSSVVGGILTGLGLIWSMEYLRDRWFFESSFHRNSPAIFTHNATVAPKNSSFN